MPREDKDNKELEKKFLCPKKDYFSWDYHKRNIDFMSDFDDDTATRFISQIRAYSKEFEGEENTDIYLYINSRGGVVTSLLAMIDSMNLVPNDFVTVGIGQCASCGAVLLSCGKKGKRYITENARVLIHQVSSGMWGKNSEIQADAKEAERLNKLLLGMLAKNCGKTVEELEQLTLGGDLILSATEAVEFGIVDAVLTKDIINRLNGIGDEASAIITGEAEGEGTPETTAPMQTKTSDNTAYETSSLKLEIKGVKEDNNHYFIKGYASTPDIDRVADIVNPDCLVKSVSRMGMPAFVHQHNLSDMPLGVCEKVYKEGNNTVVELKMPKDDYAKQIKNRIDIGAYGGLSIGYIAKDYEYNTEGYRVIKDLDWYEVSLVTIPANPNAKIIEVKKAKMHDKEKCDIINTVKSIRDVENLLCELGVSKKEAGYIIRVVKNSSQGEPANDEGGKIEGSEGEPSIQDPKPEDSEGAKTENSVTDEETALLTGVLDILKGYGK